MQSNTRLLVKELDSLVVQGKAPDLVKEYEELYFKNGSRDLSGYRLPELSYRRKTVARAQTCKQNEMCFTAAEFVEPMDNSIFRLHMYQRLECSHHL
ncbi:MAG: hypothetical protein ABSF65_07870 [Candidatus Bathyarchaeia archaeon]